MPISAPSKAAETVPEYVTSSPRLSPRLMPEKRSCGRASFSRWRTPQLTQSVGVPSTDQRFSPTCLARSGAVERQRVPRGAALLVGRHGVDVADLRAPQPAARSLRKDPVVVGDEDPGTTHADSSGMTIHRMM